MDENFTRLKKWLSENFGQAGIAIYAFLGCLILIILIGLTGLLLKWPFLFPSLGPTAILFFERGQRPAAWPRNVLIGHGVAIAAGWFSLMVFGLTNAAPVFSSHLTTIYIGCAALSLGLTAFIKHLFRAPHPPAGATTLLISLGIFNTYFNMAVLAVSILLTTILGVVLNRLSGGNIPLWGEKSTSS